MGKQSNSCTVKFSNVSKRLASFVLNNTVEGMQLVIRVVSRAQLLNQTEDCLILFVGRCAKADGFDRREGSITAKQDLGQIEAMIPPRIFQKDCPLRFKGAECLGTEILTAKSAPYQAASICNKSFNQCLEYTNEEFFQGIRVVQIEGSFIHRPHEGFWAKLIGLLTPGSGHRRMRVGNSLEDGTPYGKAIPVVLGRWQMPGIPLQFQDVGTSINFLMAFCRGPIATFNNIRCNTPNFSQPLSVIQHHGFYGNEGDQAADAVFPEHGFFSRLAYITGYCTGSDIAVEEPAPEISAMIGGIKMDHPGGTSFGQGTINDGEVIGGIAYSGINFYWTDNPVELTRYVLTDPALLNFGTQRIDGFRTAVTSIYSLGGIKDVTNAERLILPNTETARAGVDYHRYNSTGLLIPESYGVTGAQFPVAAIAKEATYEFYNPASPPTTIPLITKYRRRYTCNIAITEQRKAIDALYDTLLPSFRGFLSWNNKGQIAIRSERPADSILMRGASIATDTVIKVWDVLPWRVGANENGVATIGKILIGVGLTTAEVRSVTATSYSTDANSITLAASATGSSTATASGATFTGGTSGVPATGTITIGGTPTAGDTITATIDGIACTYTVTAGTPFGIGPQTGAACCLAFVINSDPTLRQYVDAVGNFATNTCVIRSKLGTLTVSSALANAHSTGEETIRVMMSFAGKSLTRADITRANVLDGSFKYLGNDGQTRYNQYKGTFHDPLRDFAEQPVVINDYDHQDQVLKVIPYDIDLSAVDNYNQASRLLNGAAAKYGDGVDFFSWGSNGLALQLEEGDVVCINDDSGDWINIPVRIESLTVNEKYEVNFKGRVYSTSMFDDAVLETTVPLASGLVNFGAPPPTIAFNTVDFPTIGLIQTSTIPGVVSIRGGAIFGSSLYPQYAKVSVQFPGSSTFQQIATITPDSNLKATFEFIAATVGSYTVQLEVCGTWGCNPVKPTAIIVVAFGNQTIVVPVITVEVTAINPPGTSITSPVSTVTVTVIAPSVVGGLQTDVLAAQVLSWEKEESNVDVGANPDFIKVEVFE
jgi:hypothetical protein